MASGSEASTCSASTSASVVQTESSSSSNREKSDVWKYFRKKGPKTVECTLCDKEYAFHGGTSNLRDHLVRMHSNEFKPKQQPCLDAFVIRGKCPDSRAKRISELIANMVARDLRPAAVVEGDGFKALMKFIEPGYKAPSATHIATVIRRQYEAAKVALKQKLKEDASSLAITSDIWTSCANDTYISLTAHFISADWQMVSCVLATSPFPEQHTGINIAEKLKEIVISYDIDMKRVRALVHDQGSNMELSAAVLEENFSCESLSCAAHRLQLCIQEGLEVRAIAGAIGAAKKLVGHFRHSALATSELHKRQEGMGMPPKRLQQDCPTRWNSTYYMVKTLLANRWPVTAVLSDERVTKRQYRYLDMSSEKWMVLEELVKVLEPLEVATVFLSKEQNTSLSTVYPVVHGLVVKLNATEEDSEAIRSCKVKVAAAIRRRWDLDSLDVTQVSVLATALDPRFRSLKFLTADKRVAVKAKLLQLANSLKQDFEALKSAGTDSHSKNGSGTDSPTESAPAPKRKKTAFDVLLGEEEETNGDSTSIEEQIGHYFAEKPAPRDCYPLKWWQQNEFRYQYLAKVARSILCVPATSTASERLFSTAGLTVTKLRSCLKPENVDALLFLNKKFEYLYQ